MYFFLIDLPKTDKFIEEEFANIIYSPRYKRKIISWFCGCMKVLKASSKNDTIICWFDFQAVLCFWLCRILFLKRKIIGINLMLKDKPTLRNRVVSFLYKKALTNSNFKASVTSLAYGDWLNRKLGISVSYELIHDVYHTRYEYHEEESAITKSVFCGGRNGREWAFLFKVAMIMPEVEFKVVMPKDIFRQFKQLIPDNVNVRCNIPYREFLDEMCNSSLVCLPLDTEAPAGLIVMFQAAANNKFVITTKTATTKENITEERGAILSNDIEEWRKKILYYLVNTDEAANKAQLLHRFLKEECDECSLIQRVKELIQ